MMWSIYSLTPAPWGDHYRYVEGFDTEEDAEGVLQSLEKVNILFNCYRIVEEDQIQTNRRLRAKNARLELKLVCSAHEIEELQNLIEAMKEGR